MKKYIFRLIIIAVFGLLSASCGGGGGGGGGDTVTDTTKPNETKLTGIVEDSLIVNLKYISIDSNGDYKFNGETDGKGRYFYVEGGNTIFLIGIDVLTTTQSQKKLSITKSLTVTPAETKKNLTLAQKKANVARLLLTLDEDGDPGNGVTIPGNIENSGSLTPEEAISKSKNPDADNGLVDATSDESFDKEYGELKKGKYKDVSADTPVTRTKALAHSSVSERVATLHDLELYKALSSEKNYKGDYYNAPVLEEDQRKRVYLWIWEKLLEKEMAINDELQFTKPNFNTGNIPATKLLLKKYLDYTESVVTAATLGKKSFDYFVNKNSGEKPMGFIINSINLKNDTCAANTVYDNSNDTDAESNKALCANIRKVADPTADGVETGFISGLLPTLVKSQKLKWVNFNDTVKRSISLIPVSADDTALIAEKVNKTADPSNDKNTIKETVNRMIAREWLSVAFRSGFDQTFMNKLLKISSGGKTEQITAIGTKYKKTGSGLCGTYQFYNPHFDCTGKNLASDYDEAAVINIINTYTKRSNAVFKNLKGLIGPVSNSGSEIGNEEIKIDEELKDDIPVGGTVVYNGVEKKFDKATSGMWKYPAFGWSLMRISLQTGENYYSQGNIQMDFKTGYKNNQAFKTALINAGSAGLDISADAFQLGDKTGVFGTWIYTFSYWHKKSHISYVNKIEGSLKLVWKGNDKFEIRSNGFQVFVGDDSLQKEVVLSLNSPITVRWTNETGYSKFKLGSTRYDGNAYKIHQTHYWVYSSANGQFGETVIHLKSNINMEKAAGSLILSIPNKFKNNDAFKQALISAGSAGLIITAADLKEVKNTSPNSFYPSDGIYKGVEITGSLKLTWLNEYWSFLIEQNGAEIKVQDKLLTFDPMVANFKIGGGTPTNPSTPSYDTGGSTTYENDSPIKILQASSYNYSDSCSKGIQIGMGTKSNSTSLLTTEKGSVRFTILKNFADNNDFKTKLKAKGSAGLLSSEFDDFNISYFITDYTSYNVGITGSVKLIWTDDTNNRFTIEPNGAVLTVNGKNLNFTKTIVQLDNYMGLHSNQPCIIVSGAPISNLITRPGSAEMWNASSQPTVAWDSNKIGDSSRKVNLFILANSPDGLTSNPTAETINGKSWHTLAKNYSNSGSYQVNTSILSHYSGNGYMILIVDSNDNSKYGISNSTFCINDCSGGGSNNGSVSVSGTPIPNLITQPNRGETWTTTSNPSISWDSGLIGDNSRKVNLFILVNSPDGLTSNPTAETINGKRWNTLAENYSNTGSYQVNTSILSNYLGDFYMILIVDSNNNSKFGISSTFCINDCSNVYGNNNGYEIGGQSNYNGKSYPFQIAVSDMLIFSDSSKAIKINLFANNSLYRGEGNLHFGIIDKYDSNVAFKNAIKNAGATGLLIDANAFKFNGQVYGGKTLNGYYVDFSDKDSTVDGAPDSIQSFTGSLKLTWVTGTEDKFFIEQNGADIVHKSGKKITFTKSKVLWGQTVDVRVEDYSTNGSTTYEGKTYPIKKAYSMQKNDNGGKYVRLYLSTDNHSDSEGSLRLEFRNYSTNSDFKNALVNAGSAGMTVSSNDFNGLRFYHTNSSKLEVSLSGSLKLVWLNNKDRFTIEQNGAALTVNGKNLIFAKTIVQWTDGIRVDSDSVPPSPTVPAIVSGTPISNLITQPKGGETWTTTSNPSISWDSGLIGDNSRKVNLFILVNSPDGLTSNPTAETINKKIWRLLAEKYQNTGNYSVNTGILSNYLGNFYMILIVDSNNNSKFGISSTFCINDCSNVYGNNNGYEIGGQSNYNGKSYPFQIAVSDMLIFSDSSKAIKINLFANNSLYRGEGNLHFGIIDKYDSNVAFKNAIKNAGATGLLIDSDAFKFNGQVYGGKTLNGYYVDFSDKDSTVDGAPDSVQSFTGALKLTWVTGTEDKFFIEQNGADIVHKSGKKITFTKSKVLWGQTVGVIVEDYSTDGSTTYEGKTYPIKKAHSRQNNDNEGNHVRMYLDTGNISLDGTMRFEFRNYSTNSDFKKALVDAGTAGITVSSNDFSWLRFSQANVLDVSLSGSLKLVWLNDKDRFTIEQNGAILTANGKNLIFAKTTVQWTGGVGTDPEPTSSNRPVSAIVSGTPIPNLITRPGSAEMWNASSQPTVAWDSNKIGDSSKQVNLYVLRDSPDGLTSNPTAETINKKIWRLLAEKYQNTGNYSVNTGILSDFSGNGHMILIVDSNDNSKFGISNSTFCINNC